MNTEQHLHATPAQLTKALLTSLIVAALLLVTTILPAEYNIDPIGSGKLLGLTALNAAPIDDTEVDPEAIDESNTQGTEATVVKADGQFNMEEREILLEPFDGVELKAVMSQGERFVFSWETDGQPVYTDMHGEEVGATEEFTTYWKEKSQQSGSGSFVAPFEGTHGWYWQNMGEEPITIKVKVSGFFKKIYMP